MRYLTVRWCSTYVVLFTVAVVVAWVWGIPYIERQSGTSFWSTVDETRIESGTRRANMLGMHEYVAQQRIPCLASYRPGYEDDTWGDMLAAVTADDQRMTPVEPPAQFSRYHRRALELLYWIREEGREKPPTARVGDLAVVDSHIAEVIVELEELTPAVIREECASS